jgi:hypothetical protein
MSSVGHFNLPSIAEFVHAHDRSALDGKKTRPDTSIGVRALFFSHQYHLNHHRSLILSKARASSALLFGSGEAGTKKLKAAPNEG